MENEKFLLSIFLKNKKIIIGIAVLGVAIILVSEIFGKGSSNTNSDNKEKIDAQMYVTQTEQKITKLVESIDGAGKCDVLISLEASSEYVFATEEKNTQSATYDKGSQNEKKQEQEGSENKLIIVSSGGGQNPIIIKEFMPKVKGVAVVCSGGDVILVKSRVIEAVSTLLDIPTSKISVTKKST